VVNSRSELKKRLAPPVCSRPPVADILDRSEGIGDGLRAAQLDNDGE
jgi:hypothetical protein